jgi:hypothetical protein
MAHHLARSSSPRVVLQTLTREQILPGDPDDLGGEVKVAMTRL